ncbi:unnamed protein product [Caenorhabditis brenneri]
MSTYEKTFAKSAKTDAILVVDRKKLHVNKAVLSYHSDYFNALFNSDFKEKSMEEIEIKDVWFDYFAQCLSLVQNGPMKISERELDSLLPIADQFQLPAAKHHLEQILMTTNQDRESLLKIADKYKLDTVMDRVLSEFKEKKDFFMWWTAHKQPLECIANASDETKNKLFHRALELGDDFSKPATPTPTVSIYESTFAKSDKTDAILLVDGKKLHVNKALLSYHSDYFNALFNSEFKEKSIEEIPIEDVNFENFATLLSMVQIQPIAPTNYNAENILELSDQFQLRVARRHIELFLLSSGMHNLEKIRIGEKYEMEDLLEFGVRHLELAHFKNLPEKSVYKGFSSETKNKLFYRYLRI